MHLYADPRNHGIRMSVPRIKHIDCLYFVHQLGRQVQEEPIFHQQGLACVLLGAGERKQAEMVGSCIVHAGTVNLMCGQQGTLFGRGAVDQPGLPLHRSE